MCEGAELLCRGWDAAMNRQPEAIVWNVMGMMNNSYFRIKARRICPHARSFVLMRVPSARSQLYPSPDAQLLGSESAKRVGARRCIGACIRRQASPLFVFSTRR